MVFILRSLSVNLFDKFLYYKLINLINRGCKNWIKEYPDDEWIIASTNSEHYNRRVTEYEKRMNDIDLDRDDNVGTLYKVISSVWTDNSSSFTIMIKSIFLILYTKFMFSYGHFNEFIIGILIGSLYHFIDIFINIFKYMKGWYFGDKRELNITKILTRGNKLSVKWLLIVPWIIVLALHLLKANIYTRIIGEWVMDLSNIYLYIAQVTGFLICENIISILNYSKKSANILFILVIYLILGFFI